MKIIKLTVCMLMCLLFVQCNTMESRKSKAEDAIEKMLFETMDNFQSYEVISTEIDTLKQIWMTSEKIMSIAKRFMEAKAEGMAFDNQIHRLNETIEGHKRAMTNSFLSGNGRAFWSRAAASAEDEKELKRLLELKENNDSVLCVQLNEISELYNTMDEPEKPYWHIKHKFRYGEHGDETRIHVLHYIFDPKVERVIFSWDEEDLEIQDMIEHIDCFVGGPDYLPEDEA